MSCHVTVLLFHSLIVEVVWYPTPDKTSRRLETATLRAEPDSRVVRAISRDGRHLDRGYSDLGVSYKVAK
jgi:hypothetical protein